MKLNYITLRNTTTPANKSDNITFYNGAAFVGSVLDLATDENVRKYLLDVENRKNCPTQVHKAIRSTLEDNPDTFRALNGGLTIIAREATLNDSKRFIELKKCSILNGANTQGVVRDFVAELKAMERNDSTAEISLEIIVTKDETLINEISIARNFQNRVDALSVAGHRSVFEDIGKSMEKAGMPIRISETDDYALVDTWKLMQLVIAMSPEDISIVPRKNNPSFTYNSRSRCLKEFEKIREAALDPKDEFHASAKKLYDFFVKAAPEAWRMYKHWKANPAWQSCGIRNGIKRNNGHIEDVADGLIWPILVSLSRFWQEKNGKWKLESPKGLDPNLVRAAVSIYKQSDSRPDVMGKSRASYEWMNSMFEFASGLS